MKPSIHYIFLASALLFMFQSCVKEPEYPIEPYIEFISMSKSTLNQGQNKQDTTFITFSFTDGDGDLGFGVDVDTPDVFVTDVRPFGITTEYKLPRLPQRGVSKGISGEVTIMVFTTCCILDPADPCAPEPSESVSFIWEIQVRDRAGHFSNVIETEPVTIICN